MLAHRIAIVPYVPQSAQYVIDFVISPTLFDYHGNELKLQVWWANGIIMRSNTSGWVILTLCSGFNAATEKKERLGRAYVRRFVACL